VAQRRPPPSTDERYGPHAQARKLAEKMARVLSDKPTPKVAAAVAILLAGVLASHAKNAEDGAQLLEAIHGLAERFLKSWLNDEAPSSLN
jgi:hypothetical protein